MREDTNVINTHNAYFLFFQLMRQIDLMVTAKKAEWENHLHAVQIQLDKKIKEVDFVKVQLEQKSQEVCNYVNIQYQNQLSTI